MTVNYKIADYEKKTADRPFRRGTPIQFYASDELRDAIDEWAKRQPGKAPTRSEAIRRLVEHALSGKGGKK